MTCHRDQLVTGVLTVALLATFMATLFVPQHRKVRRLKVDVAALRNETQRRAVELAGLNALQEQMLEADAALADYARNIPSHAGLGDFLEQVGELAARQDVVDPDVVPLASTAGPQIEVLPIEMSFSGTFDLVYGFVRGVGSLPRPARVARLEIAQANHDSDLLEANVTVQIYYQGSG